MPNSKEAVEKKIVRSSSPAMDLCAYARPGLLPPSGTHVKSSVQLISPNPRRSNSQFLQVQQRGWGIWRHLPALRFSYELYGQEFQRIFNQDFIHSEEKMKRTQGMRQNYFQYLCYQQWQACAYVLNDLKIKKGDKTNNHDARDCIQALKELPTTSCMVAGVPPHLI